MKTSELRKDLEGKISKNLGKNITKKDVKKKDNDIAFGIDRFPTPEVGPKGWHQYKVRG